MLREVDDNYEWNHGMNVKLGLYAIDPDDSLKERKPRRTALLYGKIAGSCEVLEELRLLYPVDFNSAPTGGVPDSFYTY